VLWLTTWIRSGYIHLTIIDLLDIEEKYPRLMGDIDRIIWQAELTKAQVKDGK
jgi:hypothetical protein